MMLKDIGVSFSADYSFSISENKLVVRKVDALPIDYWGDSIFSLTALVGNNGVGKTSFLNFLTKALLTTDTQIGVSGFLIYVNDCSDCLSMCCYGKQGKMKVCFEGIGNKSEPIEEIAVEAIPIIYYSGHFNPYYLTDTRRRNKLYELLNVSDGWLLNNALESYAGILDPHLNVPFREYLRAYHSQNHFMICEFLINSNSLNSIGGFRKPRYLIIRANESGFAHNSYLEGKSIQELRYRNLKDQERIISHLIFMNIVNMIDENEKERQFFIDFIEKWQNTLSSVTTGVIDKFKKLIDTLSTGYSKTLLLNSYTVISSIVETCKYDKKRKIFYYDLEKDKKNVKSLMDFITQVDFLKAKYFDLFYSHTLNSDTRLSSGEQVFLNMFSRLYYVLISSPKKTGNQNIPKILLLDEAEIGFHPEWQRQYIKNIIDFLSELQLNVRLQIVITTHSPIILSDIPKCCVNFLKNENRKTINDSFQQETFGQNVFNLYRRSFFLENGLIGQYAMDTIVKLEMDLKKNNITSDELKKIMQRIEIVGDENIKGYLLKLLSRKLNDIDEQSCKDRIKELQKHETN